MLRPRIREAGDAAIVAELPARIDPMTNAAVLRLAERVRAAAFRGVRDIVPAIRSLAVFYDPLHTDVDALKSLIVGRPLEPDIASEGRRHEVPVVYGGETGVDLAEVAAASSVTQSELIRLHAGRDYRVYMLGFLPGFAYLGTLDPVIVAARRATPRVKVHAGAVGVAGRQTGIYPRESPGGWALIGHSPLMMFDSSRKVPSLLAPGDTVRFVARDEHAGRNSSSAGAGSKDPAYDDGDHVGRKDDLIGRNEDHVGRKEDDVGRNSSSAAIEVRRAGLLTTVQDGGRWGHQLDGVSVAGAMDRLAHRVANAVVGNESFAATLEVTVVGPELTCLKNTVVAVAGADLGAHVGGQPIGHHQAIALAAGATLGFQSRRRGARAYIAFAGGIDVPLVLGSRSTHVSSGLGGVDGRPLRAGDRLSLAPRGPLRARTLPPPTARLAVGGARLRVLPGPQKDSFSPNAIDQLTATRFIVSAESNRMGYRLTGAAVPSPQDEMISDVTFPGALQIPPSGEPILLMADRGTTGGYPQLAILISADLPVAGQLAPGDWVEFEFTTMAEALSALQEQERSIQHFEGHAFA